MRSLFPSASFSLPSAVCACVRQPIIVHDLKLIRSIDSGSAVVHHRIRCVFTLKPFFLLVDIQYDLEIQAGPAKPLPQPCIGDNAHNFTNLDINLSHGAIPGIYDVKLIHSRLSFFSFLPEIYDRLNARKIYKKRPKLLRKKMNKKAGSQDCGVYTCLTNTLLKFQIEIRKSARHGSNTMYICVIGTTCFILGNRCLLIYL